MNLKQTNYDLSDYFNFKVCQYCFTVGNHIETSRSTTGCSTENPITRKFPRLVPQHCFSQETERKRKLSTLWQKWQEKLLDGLKNETKWSKLCPAAFAQAPCRRAKLPNLARTRKKTKLQGVLGEYSWRGHTLFSWYGWVVFLLRKKKKWALFSLQMFACHIGALSFLAAAHHIC